MDEEINKLVEEGYNTIIDNKDYWKKGEGLNLNIYSEFKQLVGKSKILELGCGPGTAIGFDLIANGFDYVGIDISEKNIVWAQKHVVNGENRFIQAEMMQFTADQPENTYDGVVTMFADFHIPRGQRVQLYVNILKILKPGGYLLFTCHPSAWEGYIADYEGVKMYWSQFSNHWYDITMRELGFTFISSIRRVQNHRRNKTEVEYFMIFQK
ncbi:MAG: class I SAM-dependent methyltransferase [Promethearchaeota archaeon]